MDEPYDPNKHGAVITGGEEAYDPAKHGTPLSPAGAIVDKAKAATGAGDPGAIGQFYMWLNTRAADALYGALGAPGDAADIAERGIRKAAEFFGVDPKVGIAIAKTWNASMNPVGAAQQMLPRVSELREEAEKKTLVPRVNAPASWGVPGKMVDAGTSAAMTAPFAPGSAARNLLPAFVGGASSEGAGNIPGIKGTWMETPARVIAGILGGGTTAGAQNYAGNVTTGVRNLLPQSPAAVEEQAQHILARGAARDQTTIADAAQRHGEFLPGTPFGYTVGPNTRGAIRGTGTMMGPARETLEQGERRFIEGADARVEPLVQSVSPLPSVGTRTRQLEQQASSDAAPIYRGPAGVPDDPQMILRQRAGAPVTTPSAVLGPDGQPIVTTRPGPVVSERVPGNFGVLQSPELANFMQNSDAIKRAVRTARGLDENFRDMPLTSMPMIDKVYKHLGGLEAEAVRKGNDQLSREIGNTRRQFAELIGRENPAYGDALEAYAHPSSLADAARAGHELGRSGATPDEVAHILQTLPSDAHRAELRGGYASWMRDKIGGSDRTLPTDRFYGNDYARQRVEQLMTGPGGPMPVVTPAGPSNRFDVMNRQLLLEREAARNMNKIRGGSPTMNKAFEASDTGAGDAASTAHSLVTKGVKGTIISKALEGVGAIGSRIAEGRTEAVNNALARYGMETNPAAIARLQNQVDAAQRAIEMTRRDRRSALSSGPLSGLLGSGSF